AKKAGDAPRSAADIETFPTLNGAEAVQHCERIRGHRLRLEMETLDFPRAVFDRVFSRICVPHRVLAPSEFFSSQSRHALARIHLDRSGSVGGVLIGRFSSIPTKRDSFTSCGTLPVASSSPRQGPTQGSDPPAILRRCNADLTVEQSAEV